MAVVWFLVNRQQHRAADARKWGKPALNKYGRMPGRLTGTAHHAAAQAKNLQQVHNVSSFHQP